MEMLKLQEIFSALGSESRLRLLEYLDEKELACDDPDNCSVEDPSCAVGEIADELGITAPSVSAHLKELRRAGLVETEKRGRQVLCSLNRTTLSELADHFESMAESAGSVDRGT